jgi:hypothetical protein
MKSLLLAIAIAFLSISAFAQSGAILISKGINLPKDSVTTQLIGSLNGFLSQKDKPNKENTFILKDGLLETSALVDEMKGIEKGDLYKPYLTNVVKHSKGFAVQLSYIGITESTPVIRASFQFLAEQRGDQFYFYSPLKQKTTYWKTKKAGNITFRYKDTLNNADVKEFQRMVAFYDKKLKASSPIIQYYCDDFLEAQHILGVEYKADYAGVIENILTAYQSGNSLIVNGWGARTHRFDPHDLFHDRLSTVLSGDITNRLVNEGCAYLYGGSWGKTWPQVLGLFKKYAEVNPDADWLKLYTDAANYDVDNGTYLRISYAINALIVQKLEKEKGFDAVMELLSCGKKEKGDENYFKALAKLTGITKADFNIKVWSLVKASK